MSCFKRENHSEMKIDMENEQGHLNVQLLDIDETPPKSAGEEDIRPHVNCFLQLRNKLIKQKKIEEKDIEKICELLKRNRELINYKHCEDNKLRSLLHITKYNFKLPYEVKQILVNIIVDMGYQLFPFLERNSTLDNSRSLFFTAAKGDYDKLVKIVEHFKSTSCMSNLHDTKEGDTVLSFMIKFGDHTNENFLRCFDYLIHQNIDFKRIDYFKDDIFKVIESETKFLNIIGNRDVEIKSMNRITDILNSSTISQVDEPYYKKHNLFHSLIERNQNFETLLRENLSLVDSDDGENTLLQLAIIKNNLEITKILLQKKANPNYTVKGRNEEVPLILAAKLNRYDIFMEILRNHHTEITNDIFSKFIASELKLKFFSSILESSKINVNYRYNEKTPLYYAIRRKHKKAIQLLLQRGAKLEDNCLNNINPKDLEDYFNSCIKFDTYKDDIEENDYKAFIVFDFFISPPAETMEHPNGSAEGIDSYKQHDTEIHNIRNIGSNKRLEYLLEHPLIHIFIYLKWCSIVKYYYCFVVMKLIFYICIGFIVYTSKHWSLIGDGIISWPLIPIIITQSIIVCFNVLEFKWEYKQYTLHFILEVLILFLLVTVYILSYIPSVLNLAKEVSAFIIILTSLSILLTLGYHLYLSKWMSMAKRVFRNFGILLLFFICPILAFAFAFNLLLPFQKNKEGDSPSMENEDFAYLPRAIFRTFILLSGDIGDKQFSLLGGYILFLCFSIGMAIILLNFWTGVAVSDIKEIEEQSIVIAFNNVIVFIDGVERLYNFMVNSIFFKNILPLSLKKIICKYSPKPFIESKIKLKERKKGKSLKETPHYGIDLLINDEDHFKHNEHFKSLKLEVGLISKIKSLYDEKDLNITRTLKQLIDKTCVIDDIYKHIQTYEAHFKRIEELLKVRN